MQIPVSIVDLLGAAMQRDESVSDIFQRNFFFGLVSNEREDWMRMVFLRLKKPCPFLENDLCNIYSVRPLPCILFPEYLVHRGTFEANARKELFRDYLCLHRPLYLSPDRSKVVAKLRRMLEREVFISSFYLFNHGPCYIDFSNLIKELIPEASSPSEAKSAEGTEPLPPNPNQALEHFFQKRIANCQPFAGVMEKIYDLNDRVGQVRFLQLMQDEILMKKLMQSGDDRALVFQFIKGKLKARRRGIIPTEYKFY